MEGGREEEGRWKGGGREVEGRGMEGLPGMSVCREGTHAGGGEGEEEVEEEKEEEVEEKKLFHNNKLHGSRSHFRFAR